VVPVPSNDLHQYCVFVEALQMEKIKSRKKKNSGKSSTRENPKNSNLEKENRIDFEGLPHIDLKKNLGCG
jgi:hypothetical protein